MLQRTRAANRLADQQAVARCQCCTDETPALGGFRDLAAHSPNDVSAHTLHVDGSDQVEDRAIVDPRAAINMTYNVVPRHALTFSKNARPV